MANVAVYPMDTASPLTAPDKTVFSVAVVVPSYTLLLAVALAVTGNAEMLPLRVTGVTA